MAADQSIYTTLTRAEQAYQSGDLTNAAILIDQVLERDFTNERAWQLLHHIFGEDRPFEVFQHDFAQKNYPEKLHLLSNLPNWLADVEHGGFNPSAPVSPAPVSRPTDPNRWQESPRFEQMPPSQAAYQSARSASPAPQPAGANHNLIWILLGLFGCTFLAVILIGAYLLFTKGWPQLTAPTARPPLVFPTSAAQTNAEPTYAAPTSIPSTPVVVTVIVTAQGPQSQDVITITPVPPTGIPATPVVITVIVPVTQPPEVVTPVTPNSPSNPALPDPAAFLGYYYNLYNTGDYATAWTYLSDRFKNGVTSKQGRPYDYTRDFVGYWRTVQRMDILQSTTEYVDSQSATVVLRLRATLLNGTSSTYYLRLHLIVKTVNSSWLIDTTQMWR